MDNIGVVAFLVAFLAIIFLAVWKIQDIVAGALKPKERYQLPHITERDPTPPIKRRLGKRTLKGRRLRRNGWRRGNRRIWYLFKSFDKMTPEQQRKAIIERKGE